MSNEKFICLNTILEVGGPAIFDSLTSSIGLIESYFPKSMKFS